MNQTNILKETQKTYMAIAFSLLLLAIAVFYLIQSGSISQGSSAMDILFKAVPMGIVIGLSASFYFGNKHLKAARSVNGLSKKLEFYKKSALAKNLCLAVPGYLASIAAIISGETQFLFISLAVLAVMLIAFPSKKKAISQLGLGDKDASELEKLMSA
ncbi:hypothetical protein [Arcticibacterium luteifluviistationis]|uniref:Uncharacterized protein n=1 Tax=Arcticibacterium luteifluviistationis TaxID=1784714 RepID=A0A2Z4G954_9BACT|nr:hypothetical protein [Arcticibacterium luteifluviistationis]AWV97588.1 hypothetical protein DJ013_05170 [Arcticibacterium luteifluviistationis]